MGYISLHSLPSESTWRDKNGKDKNLHALHEWLICFPPLSFYSFIFISLHLRCRSTSFSKYQTPRNIQTFSNRCTSQRLRAHTLLPLYAPTASLSPVTAKSHFQSLPLPVRLCLHALWVLLGWLETPSSVSIQWAGPNTFALLSLLLTVAVRDLPALKAPLLDKGQTAHAKMIQEIKTVAHKKCKNI